MSQSNTVETCPGCGLKLPALDYLAQIAHMEAEHPEIIDERCLAAGGFVKDERGKWIDTLAGCA